MTCGGGVSYSSFKAQTPNADPMVGVDALMPKSRSLAVAVRGEDSDATHRISLTMAFGD